MVGYLVFACYIALLVAFFLLFTRSRFFSYVLFTAAVPIATFMPGTAFYVGGALNPQAAYLLVLFLCMCMSTLEATSGGLSIFRRYYVWSLFLFFALISIAWSASVSEGARLFIKLLIPLMVVTNIVLFVRTPRQMRSLEVATIGCSALLIVLALINFLTGGALDAGAVKGVWVAQNVLCAPNMSPANFSFMVGVATLLALANYYESRRLIWLMLYVLLSAAVFLAFTRISMGGVLIASIVLVNMMSNGRVMRVVLPVAVGVMAIAGVFFYAPLRQRMFFSGTHQDVANAAELIQTVNTSGRTFLWDQAVTHFEPESKIFGSGLGSVDAWLNQTQLAAAIHSEFLRLYLDLGAVGLFLFLMAGLQVFMSILKTKPCDAGVYGNSYKKYRGFAVASMVFYSITLLTDNTLNYVTEFGLYVAAGIGMAIVSREHMMGYLVQRRRETVRRS